MNTIFIHGLGQNPLCWQPTITYLPKQPTIACPNLFDLCAEKDFTYDKLYAAFVAYCHKFTPPLNLCGISLGAILALNYAIDYPKKVISLVLIAAQFKMPNLLMMCQSFIFSILPEKYFLKSGLEKNFMIQLSKSMLDLDFSEGLEHIACPVLVVCGASDFVNRKAAKILTARLSNADYNIIENTGHEVNIEAPQSLALAIGGFYGQVNSSDAESGFSASASDCRKCF
ncbi:alpha/beta fold hydrolase [Solibacillus silvestris]|uniref:alpha/beta fold hydrolase n=1 Tax=Solibacillus silvestris TaxID=76853 RepID=UPI003F80B15A